MLEMNWSNTYYYGVYQNLKDAAHLGIYFDLKVEKHLYINGSRRHQHEIVDFIDTTEPKGIGFGNLYTKTLRKEYSKFNRKYSSINHCHAFVKET